MPHGSTPARLRTGRRCLELVATVHSRLGGTTSDDIVEPSDATRWLAEIGLPTSDAPSDATVRNLCRLREAIFRLLDTTTDPAPADVELLDAHAGAPAPVTRLHLRPGADRGVLVATTDALSLDQAFAVLARDAIDLLTGPDSDRLHQCEAAHCATFYLGSVSGSRRRWCSSAGCGNRIRVAAHRSRQRDA